MDHLALIGFGEAARTFARGWRAPARVTAFDVKSRDPAARDAMAEQQSGAGVEGRAGPADALTGAGAVWCLVTADRAEEAARDGAPHLAAGALWLDGNSCAPATKARAARVIEAAGGRYVDVAIMAPVAGRGHAVPLLVSGPHAEAAADALRTLGMVPEVVGPRVGQASSVKMLRSVMVKGLEALTAECLLAARAAGVEARVLASLRASDPDIDWEARGAYNLERMLVHGTRRAAEMREVAATLRDLGLPDRVTGAVVDWQAELGALGLAPGPDGLGPRADAVLGALRKP